jgi:protein SERAC1
MRCRLLTCDYPSIVFIHGLTGDREKTWTAPGAERPWPQELLPTEPGFSQARILTFGYDAYVADWKSVVSKNRVGEHARNLMSRLANYRDRDETVSILDVIITTNINETE